MSLVVKILIIIFGIILLPFIIALFLKKSYDIEREIIINTTNQKVFEYIKLLKNQDYFNKWVMTDPEMKKNFKGQDGTVGFIYEWNGNDKAGQGEQEIKKIEENKTIESEIRFIRPFVSVAYSKMSVESLSEKQTKVKWSNGSEMKYPLNFMLLFIENMLAKDMDESLNNLKTIIEK